MNKDMTYLTGLVAAVTRHMEANPSCGCSVCLYVHSKEPTEGPMSETNLAETDAWDLAEGRI